MASRNLLILAHGRARLTLLNSGCYRISYKSRLHRPDLLCGAVNLLPLTVPNADVASGVCRDRGSWSDPLVEQVTLKQSRCEVYNAALPNSLHIGEAPQLAFATQLTVEFVGLPEAKIPLAHAVAYMCRAKKKSRSLRRVPEHLKNKHFPVNPAS
jgi:hypothetical protein